MSLPNQDPMIPDLFRIQSLRQETGDTFTMELKSVDNGKFFHFSPGQFNMIYVYGVGEVPISISSNPSKKESFCHTTRVVGVVTKAMAALKEGDVVGIRGPFGSAWPVEQLTGRDVIIVAGGIGLAPLRPVIYSLLENRRKYGRVVLLYGTRSPEDVLYGEELERWKKISDMDVVLTVDRASSEWKGRVGVVTRWIPSAEFDGSKAAALVCGPEIMMGFTVDALKARGLNESAIYISMERNMKCAIGFCGHCQYGPHFICKDGPIFSYSQVKQIFRKAEV